MDYKQIIDWYVIVINIGVDIYLDSKHISYTSLFMHMCTFLEWFYWYYVEIILGSTLVFTLVLHYDYNKIIGVYIGMILVFVLESYWDLHR